jgi:hypothetical protein
MNPRGHPDGPPGNTHVFLWIDLPLLRPWDLSLLHGHNLLKIRDQRIVFHVEQHSRP